MCGAAEMRRWCSIAVVVVPRDKSIPTPIPPICKFALPPDSSVGRRSIAITGTWLYTITRISGIPFTLYGLRSACIFTLCSKNAVSGTLLFEKFPSRISRMCSRSSGINASSLFAFTQFPLHRSPSSPSLFLHYLRKNSLHSSLRLGQKVPSQ